MAGILLDTPEFRRDLMRIKTHALENPINVALSMKRGNMKPVGDDPRFVAQSGNVRIVYSVELQPSGRYHHLSVSQENGKNSPDMVQYIMELMGMGSLEKAISSPGFWIDKEPVFAVNVLVPL